ncbi:MAG: hypothetical protein OHK0028_15550 [Deltaproteobacteria bacterium]
MSTVIVGLFDSVEKAAQAAGSLAALPLPAGSVTTLSAVPIPDGAVVTDPAPVRFPKIVIGGWFAGAAAGLGLTLATYMLYPLVTGGKTIVSVPPTLIVTYEVAMLFALLGTLFGGGREMRLLRFPPKAIHDPRIHDGKIALCARVEGEDQARRVIEEMRGAGGTDVRAEEGEL